MSFWAIAILLCIYTSIQIQPTIPVALGIIPLLFSVVMIKVCIDRIKEIKKGEEDDLSQY